ncbi:MAG: GNAT family N-acetyltransferase, partial [Betaproteobacteria bacterium]
TTLVLGLGGFVLTMIVGTLVTLVCAVAPAVRAGRVPPLAAMRDVAIDRADVSKMLVHRRARRKGLGAALMRAAEQAARESGKSLLVLDTASDDAERLYARLGWQLCGVIPGYALLPQGGLCATTYFYRTLND